MQERTLMKRKNHLLAVTLSAILVTAAGCGSNDTSGLTTTNLKTSLAKGINKGFAAPASAITTVTKKSKAVQEVTSRGGSLIGSKSGASTRAATGFGRAFGSGAGSTSGSTSGSPDGAAAQVANAIDALIEKSTVTQNGNIYTVDPDENAICSDPQLKPETLDINQCISLLGGMTMVVTVNGTSGNEVTAATTRFKYKGSTFVETDFTTTSGYYQVDLGGSKILLTDIKPMLDATDRFDLPATMSGSIRWAFSAPNENNASITLSIPQTVRLVNTTAGEEIDLTLNRTDKLLSVSADATATTLDLEVGFQALNVLFNDTNATGSFPVQLSLNALTGKVSLTNEGNNMQITGLGIDGLKLKVDGTEALSVGMPTLNALLDASGANASVRFDKALDFVLDMTNVHKYFDDSGSETDTIHVSVKAPAGTVLTDAGATAIQVTTGGPLKVDVNAKGAPATATVPTDSCLDTDKIQTIVCPASGS